VADVSRQTAAVKNDSARTAEAGNVRTVADVVRMVADVSVMRAVLVRVVANPKCVRRNRARNGQTAEPQRR
jgi:hypothetical protein